MKMKGIFLLAAAALFAASQAYATQIPVNVSGSNGEPTLQGILDGFASDPGGIGLDVNTDQSNSAYWRIQASGGSVTRVVAHFAGNAGSNAFGIFDKANPDNRFQLFPGGNGVGNAVTFGLDDDGFVYLNHSQTDVQFGGTIFGFYLEGHGGLFYSDPALNGGDAHVVAFQGNGMSLTVPMGNSTHTGPWGSNEYIFGWEDLPSSQWDYDYNDFVVMVESISSVPEPTALAMFGLGLLGLGFGLRMSRRRRS